MPRKSRTPYAILGALSHGPKSGYDISCYFEKDHMFFWNESYGQIYPTLKKLLKEGLVEVEVDTRTQGPERKVYTLTPEGQEVLQSWLTETDCKSSFRDELMLKLHFGMPEVQKNLLDRLQNMEKELSDGLDALLVESEQMEELDLSKEELAYRKMTMNWSKMFYEAKLRWCQESLKDFGIKKSSKKKKKKKKKNKS